MARTRFSFFIDGDLKKLAKKSAQKERRTLANWIEIAILEKLNRETDEKEKNGKNEGNNRKNFS